MNKYPGTPFFSSSISVTFLLIARLMWLKFHSLIVASRKTCPRLQQLIYKRQIYHFAANLCAFCIFICFRTKSAWLALLNCFHQQTRNNLPIEVHFATFVGKHLLLNLPISRSVWKVSAYFDYEISNLKRFLVFLLSSFCNSVWLKNSGKIT